MEQIINIIKKSLFWIAIVFIVITFYSLTIGQKVPYEFANLKFFQIYYDIIMKGFPIAIVMTLFGTIKKGNTKAKNWFIFTTTILTSILSFALMISFIFTIGFGCWSTFSIIYRHKTQDLTIKEQCYDIGALGYGRKRIVEMKPFLKIWVLPKEVDTAKINKKEWNFVNEEGDVKFP
ncbi:hypothetical protein OX284_009370 [Flavobacterium sp. SUN046]|uniref:hypothetical protein n=1 Tax=Flavobacterium sp. SUN046 TaxID=3002440 RepID=UPI002DB7E767|nr:hypothetical protein [Flavobacterium sp. SUN046]MEC4049636.1 hypothetical protein [Flavobacterium sp. SUN046]